MLLTLYDYIIKYPTKRRLYHRLYVTLFTNNHRLSQSNIRLKTYIFNEKNILCLPWIGWSLRWMQPFFWGQPDSR